jgi:hypothetical protein
MANLAVAATSLALSYLAVELLVFTFLLSRLPFVLHRAVPEVQPLAQSSKRATVPRDYVALVGDSYAEGAGDWFWNRVEESPLTNPPFHSAHLIHRQTGRDVISFGQAGAGSIDGMVYYPLTAYARLRASRFAVEAPSDVLVYFYEGNDLDDNLAFYARHYQPRFDGARLRDEEYFAQFVRGLVEPEVRRIEDGRHWWHEQYFLLTLLRTWFLVRGLEAPQPATPASTGDAAVSVRIGGQEVRIATPLQAPSLELTADETELGLLLFEQALAYLKRAWPQAGIAVVYIPAPASSYRLASKYIRIQSYHGRLESVPAESVGPRSRQLCAAIAAIARRRGAGFADASAWVWKVTATAAAHGPRDWKHFNRRGQQALAHAAVAALSAGAAGDCAPPSLLPPP